MSASHLGKRARSGSCEHNDGEDDRRRGGPHPHTPHPSGRLSIAETPSLTPGRLGAVLTGITPLIPTIPVAALVPLLDHISRDSYIASLVPGSALSLTADLFYRRAAFALPTPTEPACLVGVWSYTAYTGIAKSAPVSPAAHLTLSNMHKFVHRLDIPAHKAGMCAALGDSDKGKMADHGVNRIEVLRIDLGVQECGAVALHTDTRDQRCILLDSPGIEARTLVLRGVPCLFGKIPTGLLPLAALEAVRDFTLVLDANLAFDQNLSLAESYMAIDKSVRDPRQLRMVNMFEPGPSGGAGLISSIPPNVETVTVVFYAGPNGGVWDPPANVGEDGLSDSWAGWMFAQLAHSIAELPPRQREFKFVNTGAIDPAAVLPESDGVWWRDDIAMEGGWITRARVQSAIENWFEQGFLSAFAWDDPRRRSSRMSGIEFLSMHEWVQEGSEWRNVFDDWEVANWRAWLARREPSPPPRAPGPQSGTMALTYPITGRCALPLAPTLAPASASTNYMQEYARDRREMSRSLSSLTAGRSQSPEGTPPSDGDYEYLGWAE